MVDPKTWFAECPFALIAFSGGVDSSLVAFLARHYMPKERLLAVISASPSLKLSELDGAKQFCRNHDIPLRVIRTKEMEDPNYFNNPDNRCYFCKHSLYTELQDLRNEFPEAWILNGQNLDDLGDYRPGIQAARESGVRAPLAECKMDKGAVREMAQSFSLECWDKPASPCLSSRIPYGERVTVDKLRRIEDAEAILNEAGFHVVRVRHYEATARVEVPPDRVKELGKLWPEIRMQLKGLGFESALIDTEGFVSGKLNRVLQT